jgi:hypothetical protein
MARSRTIDLDALARRAQGSLARLPWWGRLGVAASDPRDVGSWMKLAAEELPGELVGNKDFAAARAAVAAWSAAAELRERAMVLLDDPQIRALAGDERTLRYLVEHPDEAMKVLVEHSVEHPRAYRSGPLAEALAVASEATTFHQTHSSGPVELPEATPPPSRAVEPQPRPDPSRKEVSQQKPATDYDSLIAKPKLSQAEYQRLLSWAEEDVAAEEGLLPETYYGPKESADDDN